MRWAEMLGYAPEEINSDLHSWTDLIHPEDLPTVNEAIRAHEAGETRRFVVEHRLRTKEGAWRWVLNWGRITERDDRGRPGYERLGIHLDFTERKQAEEELRRARQAWEDIFQAIGHPSVILDAEHRVVAANRSVLARAGLSEQEIIGKACYEVFHGPEAGRAT